MQRPSRDGLEEGPFPYTDGWGWLYRSFERLAPRGGRVRRAACGYFYPTRAERWRRGLFYRLLGVHLFGAVIPTGGIVIRRRTGARMAPYTLVGTSIRSARAFYYRTCVFEGLHLPFFIAMLVITAHRGMDGRPDLAVENSVLNALVNLYPMMHHRRTRLRILRVLERKRRSRVRCRESGDPTPGIPPAACPG